MPASDRTRGSNTAGVGGGLDGAGRRVSHPGPDHRHRTLRARRRLDLRDGRGARRRDAAAGFTSPRASSVSRPVSPSGASRPTAMCSSDLAGAGRGSGLSPPRASSRKTSISLIFASASHDVAEPATSNMVQAALGCDRAAVMDVKNACNSFLNGLDVAQAFIETGRATRVCRRGRRVPLADDQVGHRRLRRSARPPGRAHAR